MPHDVDDPYFDPDDSSHNLFATAYELDQEGLRVPFPDAPRGDEGGTQVLHRLDTDTLGRATGLPTPTRDDLDAAREAELVRARSRFRVPADRSGPDEGVQRVPGPERDLEREAGEDASRRAPVHSGSSDDELDRIARYLANPKSKRYRNRNSPSLTKRNKRTPDFTQATMGFELAGVKFLPSGQAQITFLVPFGDRDEAYKLTATSGMLLEASITAVEGPIT